MKVDKYTALGTFFILLAIIIFFTDALNPFIRPLTQLFLMGSSKGKDILFFSILGLLLILSQLFEYNQGFKENKYIKKLNSLKIASIFKLKNNTYIKISLFIFVATAIFGIVIEIIMRYQMGISPFTIFVAMNPEASTTSILHSHVYKSVIGDIIQSTLSVISLGVPSGVNTGDALSSYVPKIANIIIIALPILFITQLASLKNRLAPSRLFLTFTTTCGLIGIFDGGLFATPCVGGIYGMLFIYFDEIGFNYYFAKLFLNKTIVNKCKDKMEIVKKYKILSYKTFKRCIPHLFLILIILFRIYLGFIGSTPEYYEVNIMNPTVTLDQLNNSLNNYSIMSLNKENNRTTLHISPEYNEMDLLNDLMVSLKGECGSYSLSWNSFSYVDPHTEKWLLELFGH